jgi:hypothetical protein
MNDTLHLTSGGHVLDTGPGRLDTLRSSLANEGVDVLRQRMGADGYLFLPGLLDRDRVLHARAAIAQRLATLGLLKPDSEPAQLLANPSRAEAISPEAAKSCVELEAVLYDREMIEFFESFLGAPVRHFDYIWLRTVPPGKGTPSHCDVVYMGRGTQHLYTAWTPLGDINFDLGGLMILERSNNNQRLKETYGRYDVDTFCENRPEVNGWKNNGHLSEDPNQIRRSLGGRWLTTEYRAGDVLIFTCFTVHSSLDNHSDQIRLSSDSRYQLASEPADERWVGPNPSGHAASRRRGRIC